MNIGETILAIHLREHGVRFEEQYAYVSSRRFRGDFYLSDYRIIVEVQGGVHNMRRTRKDGSEYVGPGAHGTVKGIMADNERLNLATRYGFGLLRYTPDQVANGEAIADIMEVLVLADRARPAMSTSHATHDTDVPPMPPR